MRARVVFKLNLLDILIWSLYVAVYFIFIIYIKYFFAEVNNSLVFNLQSILINIYYQSLSKFCL